MPTTEQCKKILFNVAIKLAVSPRLIAERLLNDNDKADLREGLLSIEALECHIVAWKASGMPYYAQGKTISLNFEQKQAVAIGIKDRDQPETFTYRKPFVDLRNETKSSTHQGISLQLFQ